MRKGYSRIEINNVMDFELVAEDMLYEFVESMEGDERFTREINEDDPLEMQEACSFAYTTKAMNLIDRYTNRLVKIGQKHFNDEINVRATNVLEF